MTTGSSSRSPSAPSVRYLKRAVSSITNIVEDDEDEDEYIEAAEEDVEEVEVAEGDMDQIEAETGAVDEAGDDIVDADAVEEDVPEAPKASQGAGLLRRRPRPHTHERCTDEPCRPCRARRIRQMQGFFPADRTAF